VVIDLERATPPALVEGLGLGAYEAAQRQKRGGYSLELVIDSSEAEAEAEALRGAGLLVFLVPEAASRIVPWVATSGFGDDGTALRGDEGLRRVRPGDVLLVVRGPIAREYQAPEKRRRIDTARLSPGYLFHLHLRESPQVLEIDPFDFAFGSGPPVSGSSQVEIQTWVDGVRAGAREDDAFRHLTPALGLSQDQNRGALRALGGAPAGGKTPGVLDNLAQFRSYSGWRGAVERQRHS
jgi:hypothetical protein